MKDAEEFSTRRGEGEADAGHGHNAHWAQLTQSLWAPNTTEDLLCATTTSPAGRGDGCLLQGRELGHGQGNLRLLSYKGWRQNSKPSNAEASLPTFQECPVLAVNTREMGTTAQEGWGWEEAALRPDLPSAPLAV